MAYAVDSQFQRLIANVPGVVYQFRLRPDQSMSFPYVSDFVRELYELEPDWVQRDASLLVQAIHPEDQASFAASVAQSAATLQPWHWEGRIITASGIVKWIQGNSKPEKQANGDIVWDGVLLDVSDRKQEEAERAQAEAALRLSEQRFRDVSEAAGEYIWELDGNGLYIFVTEKARLVKGYRPADLLGRSPLEFMPEEDVLKVQRILGEVAVKKASFRLEHRNITPTGEVVWEEVNGVPMLNEEGEIIGFRGAGLSITDRKLAEAALRDSEAQLRQQAQELEATLQELGQAQTRLIQTEKMSSLGQLVAGVAHEINNPVNFIYGNLNHAHEYTQDILSLIQVYQQHYPDPVPEVQAKAEVIDLDFLMEDLPKLLASMRIGAERIQKIVASLRTFSRMDEAEFKAVDLHEGIDSTLMILQNRLKARPDQPAIAIIKQYGALPLIECYAGQMNQVFMNILSNAIDALEEFRLQAGAAAPPSQIHILTEVSRPGWVKIRMIDNGAGIPEAIRQRLFDPFFTTKPVGKGTGMGLSISYQIVTERHGGTLQCRSTVGRGTEFVIEIPSKQGQ